MTIQEIQKAYTELVLEAGLLQYQMEQEKATMAGIMAKMRELNYQADQIAKADKIAADAVAKANALAAQTKDDVQTQTDAVLPEQN